MAANRYDEAMTYASRTYEIVEEQLKTRKLDDEPRLPIALGAAIEVQALALAGQPFSVAGRRFSYSDYVVTAGFRQTTAHGGPIREGLRVRVTHAGNTILRLEVAE